MGSQKRRAARLVAAASAGDTEEVVKCLSRPQYNADHLENALTAACENGFVETASLLIDHGAQLSSEKLNRAILAGNTEIVGLLKNKDDVSQIGNLHAAILSDSLSMVQMVCEASADVNAELEFDEIEYYEGEELVKGFVERFTPLMMASFRGNIHMFRFLLERGADPNLVDSNFRRTALYEAARVNCTEIIEFLYEKEVEHEPVDAFGDTPLMAACICNQTESARLLIEKNCAVNVRNNAGDTPLAYAVKFGNVELIELLIDKGATVNNRNRDKKTPLEFAKDLDTARILIEHGAAGSIKTILWVKLNEGKKYKMMHEHRTAQGDYDSRFEGKFSHSGVLRHLNRGSFSIGDESVIKVPLKVKLTKAGAAEFGMTNKWGDSDRYVIRPVD